jgi:hypothetical protein
MFYKNFIQAVGYTKQKPISEFLIGWEFTTEMSGSNG